jgi:hypothetical protein
MEPLHPKTRYVHRRNAPKHAPCPWCGTPGTRKDVLHRTVRGIAYQRILVVRVTTGEYRARCGCCTTFRTQVEGIEAKAQYTNQVREAVLDRVLEDRMSLERIQAALRRDFWLELSPGFIYDCLHWKVRQLDHAAYRAWSLQEFSGTLCVDEIHLGPYTLLLATDPLHDFPVAFALVRSNDQDHMARFLGQLKDHGLYPRVVITDGSNLYPTVLATLWPDAEHQLCIFHVLQDVHKCVLDAVRRLRKQMARRGGRGRSRRRGRPRRAPSKRRRRQLTLKDKAHFIFKHRYLIVTRRDKLSRQGQRDLQTMLEYLPGLRVLRRFVDQVQDLFAHSLTVDQARRRHQALVQDATFTADPDLAAAVKLLAGDKFEKMIAFLRSPVGQRVRTNNHVERTNRQWRYYEKVRYGWRRPRTIVRFVVLVMHRQWQERLQAPQLWRPTPTAPAEPTTATPASTRPANESPNAPPRLAVA